MNRIGAAKNNGRFLTVHSVLVYAFLYIPIFILVVFSFNASKQTAVWEGFTLDWYRKAFENELIMRSVENSLIVAFATAVLATVIGTMCALGLEKLSSRSKTRQLTEGLVYLPLVSPEVVMGAALLAFFSVIRYSLSINTVIFAHLSFSIPYVALVMRARLADFDHSLEEAAMDLGANPLQTFFKVKLPLLMPGLIASSLLVFTISIDDYVITSFVSGVSSTTLPLQIYSMIKVGVTPEVNAISTLVLVITIIAIAIAQVFYKKGT